MYQIHKQYEYSVSLRLPRLSSEIIISELFFLGVGNKLHDRRVVDCTKLHDIVQSSVESCSHIHDIVQFRAVAYTITARLFVRLFSGFRHPLHTHISLHSSSSRLPVLDLSSSRLAFLELPTSLLLWVSVVLLMDVEPVGGVACHAVHHQAAHGATGAVAVLANLVLPLHLAPTLFPVLGRKGFIWTHHHN